MGGTGSHRWPSPSVARPAPAPSSPPACNATWTAVASSCGTWSGKPTMGASSSAVTTSRAIPPASRLRSATANTCASRPPPTLSLLPPVFLEYYTDHEGGYDLPIHPLIIFEKSLPYPRPSLPTTDSSHEPGWVHSLRPVQPGPAATCATHPYLHLSAYVRGIPDKLDSNLPSR